MENAKARMARSARLLARPRLFMLAMGLTIVSGGVVLAASASKAAVVVSVRDLRRFSTTTYDILVRPAGVRSSIEEKYNLVEGNHLSGIWGGITFEQYEAIRDVPGVEIAAPIAMLGYIEGLAEGSDLAFPPEPGLYTMEETVTVDDGERILIPPEYPRRTYYLRPPDRSLEDRWYSRVAANFGDSTIHGSVDLPFLVAGIDPAQEALLVGLDKAVTEGRYLRADESIVSPLEDLFPGSANEQLPFGPSISGPVLMNTYPYLSLTLETELKRVALSAGVLSLEEILARGGDAYLDTLPAEVIATTTTNGDTLLRDMVDALRRRDFLLGQSEASAIPAPLLYREGQPLRGHDGLVLELVPPEAWGQPSWRNYRTLSRGSFNSFFIWDIKGILDIGRLSMPEEMIQVPLETYFPPSAVLRFDEGGNPVEPPATLRPTLNPAGYVQPPPLLLTTLDVAKALRGERAISAIRVRVAGVEELTPAAQRKIEAVAGAIYQRTGLTVDIMSGSSPTRVLVHVPGVGFVEELWIRKGANVTYQQRIQTGHWLVLAVLLGVGGLYTLDLAWADVVSRQRTIALQKALGWRSSAVFVGVFIEIITLTSIGGLLGAVVASIVLWVSGWGLPSLGLVIGVPAVTTALSAIAAVYLASRAARVPPNVSLHTGGLRHEPRQTRSNPIGLWAFARQGLVRRFTRSLLGASMAGLSAALLVVIGGAISERSGMLSATLLGEFVLVGIGPIHFVIISAALALAALSTANALLSSIVERRRLIGTMMAVGWRRKDVTKLFIREGALLGLVGGLIGATLGGAASRFALGTLPPSVALTGFFAILLTCLVGALSGLYPGMVAGRIPPAAALRYT